MKKIIKQYQEFIINENNSPFADLFNQIETGKFIPVSKSQFDDLEEEGWIEELEDFYDVLVDKSHITYIKLDIPEEDKIGLINISEYEVEKYNKFDILLKDKYKAPHNHIDMIDYDSGTVYIYKFL